LKSYQIDYNHQKTSQQITEADLEKNDFILGMDQQNVDDLLALSKGRWDHKIHLFIEGGVPDPWYTGDFEETYQLVTKGCNDWARRAKNK